MTTDKPLFGCMFGPVSFCCSVAVAGVAAAIAYQCGKEKHTDFVLKCESVGHFEMLPKYQHTGCGVADVDLGCTHKARVDDILSDAVAGRKTRGKSTLYIKPGSYEDAVKDFESLDLRDRRKFIDSDGHLGEYGFLPDGRKVTVRVTSSGIRPTLEIGVLEDKPEKVIKVRYGNEVDQLE